ncbi:MAG: ABC transporter ATP-binding protein [Anaerolineales bacterium]|nr:ABC transporter ATP-binding protein [Anaerolineales bacterium]
MGFFSGLDNEGYDRQYSDRQLFTRMAAYFRPHVRRLVAITLLLLVISLTGAALPVIVARGLDMLAQQPTLPVILGLFAIVLSAGVINWVVNWLRRRLTVRTIGDVELSLRTEAFNAAAVHDLSFYDEFSSGRIVSRITSDTKDFGNVVVLITDLISQVVQAVILGAVLVMVEWRLSLYLFAFLPIVFLFAVSFRRLARSVTRQGMRAMANVNASIKESVSGIAVAKNFRQETSIFEGFDAANQQSYRVNVRRGFVLSLVFPTLNALGGIGTAILVYVGGMSAAQGFVTAGAWYLFLQSMDRFFFPVLNLSSFWAQVQNGLSAAERVFALIDAEAAVIQTDNLPAPRLQGEIRFERVWFHYKTGEAVLEDFNLHICPGENIALVGHTGAGKTSIAKLIARFYEFQEGQILIDRHDIRSFDLIDYRRQLGIVSQIPFLFSGTVAENICYACTDGIDLAKIEALARQIGEGEWLSTLPQGLQTEVGERGGRLSMGQRQLVSLMRVLVQKPAIFILDEATASIDPFTEWQIQQALNMILARSTSILIAHRLSTVKAADRILVLEKGRLIEEGSHHSLLAQGGHYAHLYNTYFRHQSLEYKPEGLDAYLAERQRIRAENEPILPTHPA